MNRNLEKCVATVHLFSFLWCHCTCSWAPGTCLAPTRCTQASPGTFWEASWSHITGKSSWKHAHKHRPRRNISCCFPGFFLKYGFINRHTNHVQEPRCLHRVSMSSLLPNTGVLPHLRRLRLKFQLFYFWLAYTKKIKYNSNSTRGLELFQNRLCKYMIWAVHL